MIAKSALHSAIANILNNKNTLNRDMFGLETVANKELLEKELGKKLAPGHNYTPDQFKSSHPEYPSVNPANVPLGTNKALDLPGLFRK